MSIAGELWELISNPTWTPEGRLQECRALWTEHGYAASQTAAFAANIAIHGFTEATPDNPVAVQPADPPPAVLNACGPHGSELARETWRIVAGLAAEANMEVDDPTLAADLNQLSQTERGAETFLFVWWAAEALAQIAQTDPLGFERRMATIGLKIKRLGEPRSR